MMFSAGRYRWRVLALAGAISLALPTTATAACGPVPAGYPFAGGGKLDIEKDVTINGSSVAEGTTDTNSVVDGSGNRDTVGLTLPDLDPATFPPNSGTDGDIDTGGSSLTINRSDESFYDEVTVDEGDTLTLTGGGTYHIDKLELKQEATLNLSAGTYYIDLPEHGGGIQVQVEPPVDVCDASGCLVSSEHPVPELVIEVP